MPKVIYKNKEYEIKDTDFLSFFKSIGENVEDVLVVKVADKVFDLSARIPESGEIIPITFNSEEGKEVYWHSTSHIMAAAVKRLFPKVKVTIGPAISDGFYYDFDRDVPFTEEDLLKIEKEMKKIIEEGHEFIREEIDLQKAKDIFNKEGENYKLEILNEIKDSKVSVYKTEKFIDLCRGPHIDNTRKVKSIKLLKIAGAYWRGDEKNKMLQRIYGISFPDEKLLQDYLNRLEEAKQRDHRKLGKELDLFSTHDDFGPGLIFWHPKGAIIRTEIENFWREEHLKRGYEILYTPHVAKIDLWNKSGHTSFYKENMYPSMQMDEMEYLIKPMNCPFHILIYKTNLRSYRELPIRWCELGTVYRYEKSGVLHGLMRVRGFTQDDAHIFMTEEQLEQEIINVIDMITFVLRTFGFLKYEVFLSTKPKDSIGEERVWKIAEDALKQALLKAGLKYDIDEGGGAFYGPKIDIKIKDALNRTWQCSTIQVDFNMPERFDVKYIGEDGKEHRAIMIHRALLGSFERFFGILIEHYKGAFPIWLSPVQVAVLTITERVNDYAEKVMRKLKDKNIRVILNNENETIGAKIRKSTLQKIPFMLIIGDKEQQKNVVSVRKRTGEEKKDVNLNDFLDMLIENIEKKDLNI